MTVLSLLVCISLSLYLFAPPSNPFHFVLFIMCDMASDFLKSGILTVLIYVNILMSIRHLNYKIILLLLLSVSEFSYSCIWLCPAIPSDPCLGVILMCVCPNFIGIASSMSHLCVFADEFMTWKFHSHKCPQSYYHEFV